MQGYWGTKQAQPRPRIARVVYRLVPDKEVKNSYILMRQEGNDLDFNMYKIGGSIRAYELINGIKDISMQYTTIIEKKDKKEYKTAKEWKEEQENKEESTTILAPHIVEINLTLWDSIYQRDTSFTLTIPVVADMQEKKKMPTANKQLPNKPVQKNVKAKNTAS